MNAAAALRVAAVAFLFVAAAPIRSQEPLALDATRPVPRVLVGGVLDDPALEEAVQSGLPLRMRFRLELWRDQLIDELVDQVNWTALVGFEPLERRYVAGLIPSDTVPSYPSWTAARGVLERPYVPGIQPPGRGRYYYIAVLEIETLSLSDLDELERWLRGELQPAVRGGQSVGGAIGTGLKRLLIRVLGLPARRYEARSAPFVVP